MTVAELPPEPEESRTVADTYPEWLPWLTPIPGYVWAWDSDAGVWMYVPARAISPTRPDMPTVTDDRIVYDLKLLERYRPEELTDLMMFDPAMFRPSRRARIRAWAKDRKDWLTNPHRRFIVSTTCLYAAIVAVVLAWFW